MQSEFAGEWLESRVMQKRLRLKYGTPLKLMFSANSNSDLHLPFITRTCRRVYISYGCAIRLVHGSVLLITTVACILTYFLILLFTEYHE